MPIKTFKPYTPSRRFISVFQPEGLDEKRPEKRLTRPLPKKAGRSRGKITVRRRGGRHKRLYRLVDFKRDKRDIAGQVTALEYDPGRSPNLALVEYPDGEKRYILAPAGLKRGDRVMAGEKAQVEIGHALPLAKIPLESQIHNLELAPGRGGQIVRSAGQSAVLMAKEGKFAQVKLPSSEIRLVPLECYATLGTVGNAEHKNITLGKAGRSRHRGKRPKVRGTAMPAGEHPHGGGEARHGPGRPAKTYKGKPAKGKRTRKKGKKSDKLIIQRRK